MAFDPEEERSYLSFRVAIASGLFASLGASLAWLLWLVSRVPFAEMGVTVIVGGVVGLIVHWCKHYLHVVEKEKNGEPPEEEATPIGGFARGRRAAALVWATGFAFLGLASEHLIAHMAAHFLQPLLASLATLLPAGVILGYMLHIGHKQPRAASDLLFRAFLTSLAITAITGLILLAGWGEAPWGSLFCWWLFVAVGMQFFMPTEVNATRFYQPVSGILVAFVLMVLLTLLPVYSKLYAKLGPFGSYGVAARQMAFEVLHSPDLPSKFWIEAENDSEEQDEEEVPMLMESAANVAPPMQRPHIEDIYGSLGPVGQPASITPTTSGSQDSSSSESSNAVPSIAENLKRQAADIDKPLPTPAWNAPLVEIWGEVKKGTDSPLVCSWLVLLLFGIGLGLAPGVERTFRPPDYPSTATFKKDITVAVALLVAVIAACIGARSTEKPEDSSKVSQHVTIR